MVVLGIPGVALGVFYLLLRQFGFSFSVISPIASALIASLFLLIVGGITFYAINRWAPANENRHQITTNYQNMAEWLHIDDILISKSEKNIKLDIRIRNSGYGAVNLTRADLQILEREPFAAAYHPSASYDLLVESDHNVISVAHVLQSNEVDSFILRLGFTEWNTSCGFMAQLILYYNDKFTVISRPLQFASTF